MVWIVIASLIVIGIIFLLLEVLVVPGTTVVGFIGAGMMIGGIYLSYDVYGPQIGTYTLVSSVILSVIAIGLALRSGTWKKIMLNTEVDGKINSVDSQKVYSGDEGLTITRLNPMGKALIKEEYYEVTSKDNLISENQEIVVIKVDGNKIIVKQKS